MSNEVDANNPPCTDEEPPTDGNVPAESENNRNLNSSQSVPPEPKNAAYVSPETNSYQIISLSNLNRFTQKIDRAASLDEQAAELVANCANVFVKDVSMRLVKLAKYRNAIPSILDLKFTLKREYNMEFPQRRIAKK